MPQMIIGNVTSDKTDKTIVVTVATRKTHPIYRKQYTVNTRFMAHDPENKAKLGDRVQIVACRPVSARKRFVLDKILEKAVIQFEESDATADIPQEQVAGDSQQVTVEKDTKSSTAKRKQQSAQATEGSGT